MAYNTPAVNIYQQLENSGGAADVTPDLEACIVGPAYQIISYVAGDTASLIKTAATSTASADASIDSGSKTLTFTAAPPFSVGDVLLIPGAATGGTALQATVVSASGLVLTLDTAAGTTVSAATVTKQGILSNSSVNNTFAIPGNLPGQKIEQSSVALFANNARVETFTSGFTGFSNSNVLSISAASGVGTTTAGGSTITAVSNPTAYNVGEYVSVASAGTAGATLITRITNINGSTFTIQPAAVLATTASAMAKVAVNNVSPTTSTLLIEPGDEAVVSYTDSSSVARTFTTTVVSVASSTGAINTIVTADVLPANASLTTTVSANAAAGANSITLNSAAGFAAGDTIVVRGAGGNGADHIATIGSIASNVISGLSPALVTSIVSGTWVRKQTKVVFQTRKVYNNLSIPATQPFTGGSNYDVSTVGTSGTFIIRANPEVIYGKLISGTIHVAYKALRTDLSGSILTINNADDNAGIFGTVSEDNPLALGVQMALANTTTRVRAIAVSSNDLAGYMDALDMAESERVYGLVPLTQEIAVCQAFGLHATQMSTPEEAMWRTAIVNTAIPTLKNVGSYTADLVNANGGNNAITLTAGKYVFTSSNSTFISDNTTPGDNLVITAGTGASGTLKILNVISNTQLEVDAQGPATGISFYITRTLSKTQRAEAVAATSKSFGSSRTIHIQPDTAIITVGGRRVALPGYYLACAVAGLIAGMPSQQGFTNMSIAGVSDLANSNFTFTRAQLNTMAAAGTFLFIQDTQGSAPAIRHELTTDMSVYEYRELQAVKNWDFLSYFYFDSLKQFIGRYNITNDTVNVIRQTIISGSELLKSKKKPRIGAPLVDYKITKLEQSKTSKDRLTVVISTTQPAVLNFADVYLVI